MTTVPDTIPHKPSSRMTLYHALLNLFLFLGIVAGIVLIGIFSGPHTPWILHAITGSAGMVLLVIVILTGAIRSGRIKSLHFPRIHFIHKLSSVCFSGIAVGTFLLGLLVTAGMGEEVLRSFHGLIGLAVAALSTIQVLPSLFITQRQSIRKVHRIVGYLIVPLFLIQVYLGIQAAELLEAGYD